MNSSRQTHGIALVLATIGALLVFVGSAQAGSRPSGMSKAEYRALMLRSQALNERYGLGAAAAGKPAGMSWPEYRALVLRSEALNRKYGLGSQAAGARPTLHPATVVRDSGFVWGDFGLGAAAMLGLVLVTGGLVAGSRHGRKIPRTRISS